MYYILHFWNGALHNFYSFLNNTAQLYDLYRILLAWYEDYDLFISVPFLQSIKIHNRFIKYLQTCPLNPLWICHLAHLKSVLRIYPAK